VLCLQGALFIVGDDADSDINGALDAGLTGVRMRTGKYG